MKTSEFVARLAGLAAQHQAAAPDRQKIIVDTVKSQVDAFVASKELAPLAATAKLARIGGKVIATMVADGLSVPEARHFAAIIGLPKLETYGEGGHSSRPRAPASAPSLPPVQGDSPATKSDVFVFFRAMDGTSVPMLRAVVAASDAILLKNTISEEYSDRPDSEGHYTMPLLRHQHLDLLAQVMAGDDDLERLTDKQLKHLSEAADIIGSDSLKEFAKAETSDRLVSRLFDGDRKKALTKGLSLTAHEWMATLEKNITKFLVTNPTSTQMQISIPLTDHIPTHSISSFEKIGLLEEPFHLHLPSLQALGANRIKNCVGHFILEMITLHERLEKHLKRNGFFDVKIELQLRTIFKATGDGISTAFYQGEHTVSATLPE